MELIGNSPNGSLPRFQALAFNVACERAPQVVAVFERSSHNWGSCSPRGEYQRATLTWEHAELEDWPPPAEVNAAACATSDAQLDGVGWSTWSGLLSPADFAIEPRP